MQEMVFATRAEFREWLQQNSQTSAGIWLVFAKHSHLKTIKAAEALEEALCHGWIDGQMQSLDETRYIKYFAARQKKSQWSEKNKRLICELEAKGLMSEFGRAKVQEARQNGTWDVPRQESTFAQDYPVLAGLIEGHEPAYANFLAMPLSVRKTYTLAYMAGKTAETRQKTLARLIDRLNKNLKPMERE